MLIHSCRAHCITTFLTSYVCECPRICLLDELILGYLIVSKFTKINVLKICYFILVVGRRLTNDSNVLWLCMGLQYQPQMVNKCGAILNSYITGRADTNWIGPISFPLCPSRVLHGLPWEWTWASSVTSWQQPGQMSVAVHLIVNIWFRFIYKYIQLLVSWYFTFSVKMVYIIKLYYQQIAHQISLTHRYCRPLQHVSIKNYSSIQGALMYKEYIWIP
jgi:hypothetical protein